MTQKYKKAINTIAALFACGGFLTYLGFFKGYDIAISTSQPADSVVWSTSQEFIAACTYFPIILGVSIILLSIMLSTVLFLHWINASN